MIPLYVVLDDPMLKAQTEITNDDVPFTTSGKRIALPPSIKSRHGLLLKPAV